MSFFNELKRRNVIRVGLAYVLMGWVLLQGADFLFDLIGAPNWVIQSLTVIAVLGLPVALLIAWAFELTPEGIKREEDVHRDDSITPHTSRKLDRAIIGFLALIIVMLGAERFYPGGESPADTASLANDSGPKSIAVLPFVNMSSDAEQEYFSDGITEEILNRLAKVQGLQVSARTSAFSFKGQNLDIRKIAQTLGVQHILEGSVRRDGEQLRITAQLIRAEDGFHLWSESYDRQLESIFAVQDEISGEIAESLQVSLGILEPTTAARSVNPRAYDLYLKARGLHRDRGPGVAQAVDLFKQSLAIDPEFAPAWAGLSHALNVVKVYVSRDQIDALGDTEHQSFDAAMRALELDPNLATGLHAMAMALLTQYRLLEANDYFERAVQSDPDSTMMMEDYNHFLTYMWQPERALPVARRMLELDPLVAILHYSAKTTFHSLGDVEARNRHIDIGLELNPMMSNLQSSKLKYLLEAGELATAKSYAETMDLQDWTSVEDLHRLIDWSTAPDKPLDEGMIEALQFVPDLAIFANRHDLWLEHALTDEQFVNWETKLGYISSLNTPIGGRLYRDMLGYPQVRELIQDIGLVAFWNEKGWPSSCQPMGDNDFRCN